MTEHTFMHSYERVDDVEEVAEVVEDHPGDGHEIVKLPEHSPANHHDRVVEDGHVDNPQPLENMLFLNKSSTKGFKCSRCSDMIFQCLLPVRTN